MNDTLSLLGQNLGLPQYSVAKLMTDSLLLASY